MREVSDAFVMVLLCARYLQNSNELQQFLCSFHLVKEKSSVLLIDGLERFFGADRLATLWVCAIHECDLSG